MKDKKMSNGKRTGLDLLTPAAPAGGGAAAAHSTKTTGAAPRPPPSSPAHQAGDSSDT